MATNQDLPATDSATVLHDLVGDDATAAFENDPKFIDSNPGDASSSENIQDRSDRRDIQGQPDLKLAADDDDDEEDEDDVDDDDDLDDEDEEEDDDEDEDDLDEDDDEEDDDEEYEDDDDDDEDEDEDDEE